MSDSTVSGISQHPQQGGLEGLPSSGDASIRRPAAITVPASPAERPLAVDPAQSRPAAPITQHDFRPQVDRATTDNRKYSDAVKDRWKEYGVGAPFKAVSDVLIKDPFQPLSKAGIIGWLKALVSIPMELLASTIGFFSGIVTNTGPELKGLFGKEERQGSDLNLDNGARSQTQNQEIPAEEACASAPLPAGLYGPDAAHQNPDEFADDAARERARQALSGRA